MEFNFYVEMSVVLTEQGAEKAMKTFKTKENLIIEFKKGIKELIMDELAPDIANGQIKVSVFVTGYHVPEAEYKES